MYQWAEKELESLNLGDKRREKRLIKIVEDLANQPGESVPQACGDIAATTAAYDFWKSPYFQPDEIRLAHEKSTIKRIESHQIILGIQDTTNIDLTRHPKTRDLGYLDCATSFGLKVHSTLAASIDGVPLGIIHQQVWTRDIENLGIAKKRRTREIEEKESQRWLDAELATHKLIKPEKIVVTVADSEADIFDLFNQERPENFHLLIRGTHNRKVDHKAKYLHEAINATLACGQLNVEVKRSPQQQNRIANLTIRFATLSIQVPLHHIRRKQLNPVKLQVILAKEENPPSLRDAVRMIAKLGGFLGRNRDGEPGVKTIWRGLKRLHDIAATWKLLQNHAST